MPRKQEPEEAVKSNRLTLAQLAAYDDVSTDAMVDQAYFWSRIRKNRNKHFPVRGIREDDVPQILLHQVIVAKDPDKAEKMLLDLPGLRRYLSGLKSLPEKGHFRRHLRKYINMYLPDCPFEVSTTNRYTITTQEAAVTARKRVKQGETIKYLSGTLVPLTSEESDDLDLTQRNFSIVVSSRKKTSSIFLGPARFANHDCDANGRLVTRGNEGMEVIAVKNIEVGDEITVTYGEDYFGPNNAECLCHSCELLGRNGWASGSSFSALGSRTSTPTLGTPGEPYSFRRKRKYQLDTSSESTPAPSTSPRKRRLDLNPSGLSQGFTPPASSASRREVQSFTESAAITVASEDTIELEAGLGITTPLSIAALSGRHGRRTQKPSILSQEVSFIHSAATETSGLDKPLSKMPDTEHRIKKKRLVDLMTANYAPESTMLDGLSTSGLQRSTSSEDSGSDSRAPTQTTDATDLSKDLTSIEVDFIESCKYKSNDTIEVGANDAYEDGFLEFHPPELESHTSSSLSQLVHSRIPYDSAKSIPRPTKNTNGIQTINVVKTVRAKDKVLPSIEQSTTTTSLSPGKPSDAVRIPGDYVLTRKLLAQSFDRWVQCQTCRGNFVQPNGYQTRRECPRCERHSMLYGLGWPNTEPDPRRLTAGKGKNSVPTPTGRKGKCGKGTWVEGGADENGRVMDHRTVHRFLYPDEEMTINRRALLHENERRSANGFESPDPAAVRFAGDGSESMARDTSSSAEDGKRRSRRFVSGGRVTM